MASWLLAEALLLSIMLPSDALQFGNIVNSPSAKPEFESDEVAREAAEEAENMADRLRQKEMWDLPAEIGGPVEPGCFVRTPAGCPSHPEFHSSTWKHATHAERSTDAASDPAACEVLWKEKVAAWCGTADVEVVFVPESGSGATTPREQQSAGGEAGAQDTTANASRSSVESQVFAPPREPGCFVRTPSGCPNHPGSGSVSWKHDSYAERYTQAKMNRTVCEGQRRDELAQWCGAADVEALFVIGVTAIVDSPPRTSRGDAAREPGCYIRTPSGCAKHPTLRGTSWQYEHLEEAAGEAAVETVTSSLCEVDRRDLVAEWCGVGDVEALFVPGVTAIVDSPPKESQAANGGEGPADSAKETFDSAEASQTTGSTTTPLAPGSVDPPVEAGSRSQDPTEPGCFMRTPTGCPNHPGYNSSAWKHEEYGERTAGAKVNRTVCEVERKLHVVHWCGTEDVEVRFIQEPGCYVRTPWGCPNHPSFGTTYWKHEEYGESHSEAKTKRAVCEVARREHVVHWCGAVNVEMLFIPEQGALGSTEANQSRQETFNSAEANQSPQETFNGAEANQSSQEAFTSAEVNQTPQKTLNSEEETFNGAEANKSSKQAFTSAEANPTPQETFNGAEANESSQQPFTSAEANPTPQETFNSAEANKSSQEAFTSAEANQNPQETFDSAEETFSNAEANQSPQETFTSAEANQPPPKIFNSAEETFNGVEANQSSHETFTSAEANQSPQMTFNSAEEVPTEPGCYVRTPSGCPRSARAGNSSWRRDVRGERGAAAKGNRTSCEVDRRARLVEWCGSEDVEMLFVPPRAPGCYVRTPTGCPNHPSFNSSSWEHDKYGENYTTAKVARWRCELSRKLHLAHWCGTNDVRMKFVPPAWDNLIRLDEGLDRKRVARPPSEPGCFVRTPSGCPNHPGFSSANWKHLLFSAAGAHTNRSACEGEHRARIAEWCSAQDVEVAFVPMPRPGCYVRMPSGCPRHPASASVTWRHDYQGERQMRARGSRAACEWARKAHMRAWCGVDDVDMLYVPRGRARSKA